MKKCCFIVPYFGRFNNYFQLFLNSCRSNKTFNWLIFTDDKTEYNYPENVKVVYTTFEEIRDRFQSKFDFKISLDRPYKLCDFKPTYGYVFEDYLKDYKFWGECDIDTIMGNLEAFFPNSFLENYDKILCLGHMVMYRNTAENNRVFMNEYHGYFPYRLFLSGPEPFAFDEEGNPGNINRIFKESKKRVYDKDLSLNFEVRRTHFVRTMHVNFDVDGFKSFAHEKYRDALYVWEDGNVRRYYKEDGNFRQEDFPYVHLQKRIMKIDSSVISLKRYKIVPNAFLPIEVADSITIHNFNKIRRHYFTTHAWDVRWPIYKTRILKFLGLKK